MHPPRSPSTRAPSPNRARPGPGQEPRPPVGAIDLGTNTCRLLIAQPHRGGFHVLDAFSRIVRLGEGQDQDGALSEEAMARTVEALTVCARKLTRRGVTHLRAVATEACRRARNLPEFQARVLAQTGIPLEVIRSEEEARLSFLGCAPLIRAEARDVLLFDIGGGSTEVLHARRQEDGRPRILHQTSAPVGISSLVAGLSTDRVTPELWEAMVAAAMAPLTPFAERLTRAGLMAEPAAPAAGLQVIGASGTVTTLAALHLRLPSYNRLAVDGRDLKTADARAVIGLLRGRDRKGRAELGCIGPERAELVLAGCAILEALFRLWPVARISVADRGVREGILMDLIGASGRFLA